MFVHLKSHSYYSFLRGLASPEALVQAAVRDGMDSLAMTDFVSMTGAIEFYRVCHDYGIQPIIGMELSVIPPAETKVLFERGIAGHGFEDGEFSGWVMDTIVLLAEDLSGWRSLCRLSSAVGMKSTADNDNVLSLERLAHDSAGLICLCGGKRGLVTRSLQGGDQAAGVSYLAGLREIFPGKIYLAIENQ